MNLQIAIDRAIIVLKREQEEAAIGRSKFEPGGNLYTLIERGSPAALERRVAFDREIKELGEAIEYLERER